MDITVPPYDPPKKVRAAVTILYLTLGIGAIRGFLEGSSNLKGLSTVAVVTVGVAVLGIMALLVFKIGSGKNWARVTFLVLFLMGVIPSIPLLIRSFSVSPVSGILGLTQALLQLVALILLFQREASDWFRGKGGREPPNQSLAPTL